MRLMMGAQGERVMQELVGRRVAGCGTARRQGAATSMIGPGMMGGSHGNGGWGAMMRSGDWSWIMGGHAWRSRPASALPT